MTSTPVYLSLGSNLGDRVENLRAALAALPAAGFQPARASALYETEPVDYLDQPWFLNCAAAGETSLAPHELLHNLRGIEAALGSAKAFAKGPRLLDIDILVYGDAVLATPELQVPHPRMLERRFVLAPLAEIAPHLRHPLWDADVSQLLSQLEDTSVVRRVP